MSASSKRRGLERLAASMEPQPLAVVAPPEGKVKKRNPAPGVRVVGGRIYHPEHGKTCHQCRQKTTDFAAACKQVKGKGPCPIIFCKKCLLNRYGENAEEAAGNNAWTCPKCRGICNCSFCRKKKGEMPTGIMAHLAKASGCTSVHDLLVKGSDVVAAAQTILKVNATEKQGTKRARETDVTAREGIDLSAVLSDEGNENVGIDLNSVPSVHIKKKLKRHHSVMKNPADEKLHDGGNGEPLPRDESPDAPNNNIVLPKGTLITNIAGVELDNEDVGAAIQFVEFCRAFAEFFKIRKGQPEKILKDIIGGRERRLVSSHIADFHITLLSVIQEGRGNNELRKWIDMQNEVAAEPMNAAREKARAAKEKEKELKERLKDIKNKTAFMPNEAVSVEENKDLFSQIREAQEVKRAVLNDLATMENQGDDLWTKPLMVEKGLAYWKLEGYCDNATVLMQEYGDAEVIGNKEKWFMFTEDEEKVIKEYIVTRSRRQIRKPIRV